MVYENKDKLYPPFSSGIEWHNEFNIFFWSLTSLKISYWRLQGRYIVSIYDCSVFLSAEQFSFSQKRQ